MNKFIGIGRLTKDPEVSDKVARYTIAIDRAVKTEGQPTADFINCVVFGKAIDFVSKYLHKGMKIAVEGRIQTGSYTKEDGSKAYSTALVVDRHEFCESKSSSSVATTEDNESSEPQFVDLPEDDGELPF